MHLIPRLNKVIPLTDPPYIHPPIISFRSLKFLPVCPQVGLRGHPDPLRWLLTLSRWPNPRADLWPPVPYRWPREMHSSAEIPQWVSIKSLFLIFEPMKFCEYVELFSTAPSPFENIIEEVIHPCNPNPCPSNHLCEVNRKGCHPGQDCKPYFCVPGMCFFNIIFDPQCWLRVKTGIIFVGRLQTGWSVRVPSAHGGSDPDSGAQRSGRLLRGVHLWAKRPPGKLRRDALHRHHQDVRRRRTEEKWVVKVMLYLNFDRDGSSDPKVLSRWWMYSEKRVCNC